MTSFVSRWDDYNRELLSSLFEGDEPLNEYIQAKTSAALSADVQKVLTSLVNKLQSLIDRVHLATEPSTFQQRSLPRTGRPTLFIGSSTEGLDVANTVQLLLDHDAEVEIWTQGVFQPSNSSLASLVQKARAVDFALLVLSADDMTEKRGTRGLSPRDNVVFELGLFMGALGPERVFMLHSRQNALSLPSDLAGVTPCTYAPHSTNNLRAALGAPCTGFCELVASGPSRSSSAACHASRSASSCSRVAGGSADSPLVTIRAGVSPGRVS